MGCGRYENELRALLEGLLDGDRMEDLLRHAGKCSACRAEIESIKAVEKAVKAAYIPPSTPAEAAGRILSALPAARVMPTGGRAAGRARLGVYAAAAPQASRAGAKRAARVFLP